VPMGFALFATILLAVFFHPPERKPSENEAVPVAAH
jgi:hypothetical protein